MMIRLRDLLLYESPDSINDGDKLYVYGDTTARARPFTITSRGTVIGKVKTDHGTINVEASALHRDITLPEKYAIDKPIQGRLFFAPKVFTFWKYDKLTTKVFKDAVKEIEEKLKLKIWNSGWQIEAPWGNTILNWEEDARLISIEQYRK